jgi:hypothetical protein
MGDTVFKKLPNRQIITGRKSDMSRVMWSRAQVENRIHMSEAIANTQRALADPRVRARYERKAKKRGLVQLLVWQGLVR